MGEGIIRLHSSALYINLNGSPCLTHVVTEGALSNLRTEKEPREGWKERTVVAVAEHQRRYERTLALAIAAGMTFAVIGVLVYVVSQRTTAPQVALHQEIVAGGTVKFRGEAAQPGDVLLVRAETAGQRYAEIRIYRDDRLWTRIPSDGARQNEISARVVLDGLGSFQVLLITSNVPLPPTSSNLDEDAGSALRAGANIELGDPIVVR
jgi:hypothetical protein